MRCRGLVVMAGVSALSSSCAWSNPENRPVWNAFEEQLVPDDGGLFYAALPVTVPLGVVAILTDTLVAHPVQVVDDAWRDAARVWRPESLEFEQAYYTELAGLPLRAVWTPVVFVGSWFGRSVIDLPEHSSPLTEEERARAERERLEQVRVRELEEARERQEQGVRTLLDWLAMGEQRFGAAPLPDEFDKRLADPLRRALAGDAAQRRTLHAGMVAAGMPQFGPYDARVGLRDEDPVVRFLTLDGWRPFWPLDDATRNALLQDPIESIRLRARSHWPN